MNLTFPQLLAGAVGALLIYSAVVNKTPVQVITDAFSPGGAGPAPAGAVSTARTVPGPPPAPGGFTPKGRI